MKSTLAVIFSAQARKAWSSGIGALFFGVYGIMLTKGYTSVTDLGQLDWMVVVSGVLGVFGITYGVPNSKPEPVWVDHRDSYAFLNKPVDTTPSVPDTINTIGTSGDGPA